MSGNVVVILLTVLAVVAVITACQTPAPARRCSCAEVDNLRLRIEQLETDVALLKATPPLREDTD